MDVSFDCSDYSEPTTFKCAMSALDTPILNLDSQHVGRLLSKSTTPIYIFYPISACLLTVHHQPKTCTLQCNYLRFDANNALKSSTKLLDYATNTNETFLVGTATIGSEWRVEGLSVRASTGGGKEVCLMANVTKVSTPNTAAMGGGGGLIVLRW